MLRPVLKTPPSTKPVSVADVKANSRIEFADDDTLVEAMIDSAIAYLDGWSGIMGRCLINQVWIYSICSWPAGCIKLPFPDVSAAVISYVDENGVTKTFAGSNYRRIETESRTVLEWVDGVSLPSLTRRSDAISIEMTVGYGGAADAVPVSIRRAIIMLASQWYERREAADADGGKELPFAVTSLLAPHRRVSI